MIRAHLFYFLLNFLRQHKCPDSYIRNKTTEIFAQNCGSIVKTSKTIQYCTRETRDLYIKKKKSPNPEYTPFPYPVSSSTTSSCFSNGI